MGILWIIRHGQASFGTSDYDRLSDRGRVQCQILGQFLARTGVAFDRAFSGAMRRQAETAELVLAELAGGGTTMPVVNEPAFNEYDHNGIITALLPGLLQDEPQMEEVLPDIMQDNHLFQKMFVKIVYRWISGDYATPATESFRQYVHRVEQGLIRAAESAGEKDQVAVFTSGGVVSIAMKLAVGLNDREAMRLGWWVKNSAVTLIEWRKERFNLIGFNNLAHLEMENRAELITYR